MKTLLVISVLTSACSSPSGKKYFTYQDSSPITPNITINIDSSQTSDERAYIDSAHFHIIRGNYTSGAKFIEVYENKLTRLDYSKEYYPNGRLKEEGLMTYTHHVYVGLWKYYSINGTLDSAVNYDDQYKIPYFKALEIAKQNGYKMPDLDVALVIRKDKKYWEVIRWEENSNHSGRTGNAILIDIETGEVGIPKEKIISIY